RLPTFLRITLVCGWACCMSAQTREGTPIGGPQPALPKRPTPDPNAIESAHKYLQVLTTLDLIGHSESELQRLIPFDPTSVEKDNRTWYWDGSSVIRNGDIIGRFRVFTVVRGKITKHEIIDRLI